MKRVLGLFFIMILSVAATNLPDFTKVSQDLLPVTVNISTKMTVKESIINPFDTVFFGQVEGNEVERDGSSLGSGFVVSSDGLVVTNNHIVQKAADIIIKFPDLREYEAELLGADPSTDIALLKIKSDDIFDFLEFEEDELILGQWVIAAGNPFGLNSILSSGIVSATGRSGLGIETYENFIQTDATINKANSGGPLVNLDGKVVGVNTALVSTETSNLGLGYAIPSTIAKRVVDNLVKYGEVKRPMLGVVYQNDFSEKIAKNLGLENNQGALISQVLSGSPAENAGLQKNDVIKSIDNKPVNSYGQAQAIISAYNPGDQVKIDLYRNGKLRNFAVTLSERDLLLTSDGIDVLGMTIAQLDSKRRLEYNYPKNTKGVVITNVERGSLAEQLGLREGLVISEVNKDQINTLVDFNKGINQVSSGDNLLIYVENKDFGRYVLIKKD